MKADTFQLARDIMQGRWLIAEPEKLLPVARAFLSRAPLEMEVKASLISEVSDPESKAAAPAKVAIIPLHGTMTKYDTCESYGTTYIARKIKEASDDDGVIGIVIDIDSGGGSSSAIPPMLEAICYAKQHGKPVYAHVDMCGSAAFWVASQCHSIYMDNEVSQIGSVGALYVFYDSTAPDPQTGLKEITIYSRKSSEKNLAYRKAIEGNYDLAMDELDALVEKFQEAVITGRPDMDKDADGVLSGRMFAARKAISLGMADAVKTLDETVQAVFAIAEIG